MAADLRVRSRSQRRGCRGQALRLTQAGACSPGGVHGEGAGTSRAVVAGSERRSDDGGEEGDPGRPAAHWVLWCCGYVEGARRIQKKGPRFAVVVVSAW